MSVKELVVVPKQKFDLLSRQKDNFKDSKSVGCQTENHELQTGGDNRKDEIDSLKGVSAQRVKDGIPGELYKRRKQKRKINWIPY